VNIREEFGRAQSDVPYSSGVTLGIQRGVARRLRINGLGPHRQNVSAFPQVTSLRYSGQDWQSVRIYAYDQCPRQDSNLRSRLRRGLLCTPLTSGNEFLHTMIGGVSGATAWARLLGRNGMSSNRMRRLHSKTIRS
jgi:hypothetical protein